MFLAMQPSVLSNRPIECRVPQQPRPIPRSIPLPGHLRVHRTAARRCARTRPPKYPHSRRLCPADIEWRLIYVSCPGNEELDQELEAFMKDEITAAPAAATAASAPAANAAATPAVENGDVEMA